MNEFRHNGCATSQSRLQVRMGDSDKCMSRSSDADRIPDLLPAEPNHYCRVLANKA